MYRVFDKEFKTFDEVIKWAYDVHLIDVAPEHDQADMSESDMQRACSELETMLATS